MVCFWLPGPWGRAGGYDGEMGNCNGEFGAEEEGKVEKTGPGPGGVAAGE